MFRRSLIAGVISIVLLPAGGLADSVADFYRGQTVTLFVGSGAGGGYDFFGRALAQHIGKHIPGQPTVIVQNMPGAGGAKMVNYAYTAGPQDGTAIGMPLAPTPMAQLLRPEGVRFDAAKLHWLGNMEESVGILFTWHGSATKTIEDAMQRETVMAGSGKASATYQLPALSNALLGTQFKIVLGYSGAAEMESAIEKGEADGRMAVWQTLKSTKPDWIEENKVNFLAQGSLDRSRHLPDTPTFLELVKTDEGRQIFEFMALQSLTGRPLFAPPGVPAERVAALRRAFDAAVRDPAMIAQMEKAGVEIEPTSGEEVQKVVEKMIATPPEIIRRIRELIE